MTESVDADRAWMREAFLGVQQQLELRLRLAAQSIAHAGTKGTVNEDHWIEVFRAYLPKRYEVATGFVIDSLGNRSQQIDLVVYDKHYTPTLLDQQNHRYIPAEAVYAVFESKPHIDKDYLEYAGEKAASVRKLHRTSANITHVQGVAPPRPLFEIVAGIIAPKASWADGLGDTFISHLVTQGDKRLDCGCALADGAFDTFGDDLLVKPVTGALVYFLFRLLGKLQSLGTVPAIDWTAYVAVLGDALEGS